MVSGHRVGSSVQFSRSVVSHSLWPHGQPGFPIHHQLPELVQTYVHPWTWWHQWCHPIISSFVFPFSSCLHWPSIRIFSNELVPCIRWPKYWSFSFSISPANEYSGLISFQMDWFDLLAVQGTLKSLQHHSSKASILWCSACFMVLWSKSQSTHNYWKNHWFDYMHLCRQSCVYLMHVHPWWIHVNVWQNQYSIIK